MMGDSYADWLRASRLGSKDCLFVFSTGGSDVERNIGVNLVNAMKLARELGASITGIVGRDDGTFRERADACITSGFDRHISMTTGNTNWESSV
jgi:D-sedoheptulose 7-phosphate isomerase